MDDFASLDTPGVPGGVKEVICIDLADSFFVQLCHVTKAISVAARLLETAIIFF